MLDAKTAKAIEEAVLSTFSETIEKDEFARPIIKIAANVAIAVIAEYERLKDQNSD